MGRRLWTASSGYRRTTGGVGNNKVYALGVDSSEEELADETDDD